MHLYATLVPLNVSLTRPGRGVPGDVRGRGHRRSRQPHLVETNDDNVPVIRLAEMYLIRAEANWRLGAPAATVRQDVDVVRAGAGAAPLDE